MAWNWMYEEIHLYKPIFFQNKKCLFRTKIWFYSFCWFPKFEIYRVLPGTKFLFHNHVDHTVVQKCKVIRLICYINSSFSTLFFHRQSHYCLFCRCVARNWIRLCNLEFWNVDSFLKNLKKFKRRMALLCYNRLLTNTCADKHNDVLAGLN